MQNRSPAVSLALGFVALAPLACSQQQTPAAEAPPAEAAAVAEEPGIPADEGVPPSPPRGKVAACTTDASCNADPAISALWGTCDVDTGKCSCREGAELDPSSERCSPSAQ